MNLCFESFTDNARESLRDLTKQRSASSINTCKDGLSFDPGLVSVYANDCIQDRFV